MAAFSKMALPIWLLSSLFASTAIGFCPPSGPVLPPPDIAKSFSLDTLRDKINALTSSTDGASPPWNVSTTSFSLQMTSRQGKFFEHHYTASLRNSSGAQVVRGDTSYRVASVTKAFNVLALLLAAGESLDRPISSFVQEVNTTRYRNVTLRMLASQLSGTPRWGNAFDMYTTAGPLLTNFGFPQPPPSEVPTCDTGTNGRLCTRAEFFAWLNEAESELTWQPGDKAAYSNLAYILLAYALENITKTSFNDLLRTTVLEPIGLAKTGLAPPSLSDGIIPAGMGSDWFPLDIGTFKPTAGLYSTPDDLATFLRSILNHQLLSQTQTNLWLKPAVFLSSLHGAVGMPWEILRPTHLTSTARAVDVYTKSGSLPGYAANVALLPDYDVGVTVNVAADLASSELASQWLMESALEALIPEMERLARKQAADRYAGRYASGDTKNGAAAGSSMTLVVDDGPGLKVTEWSNDGKSILTTIAAVTGVKGGDAKGIDVRAYPVGSGNRWRLSFERTSQGDGRPGIFQLACQTWFMVDSYRYAGLPTDEIVFAVGADGAVKGVRSPGLRQVLNKL